VTQRLDAINSQLPYLRPRDAARPFRGTVLSSSYLRREPPPMTDEERGKGVVFTQITTKHALPDQSGAANGAEDDATHQNG
jgi:hypothetical protein